jgi:hypothetical protein
VLRRLAPYLVAPVAVAAIGACSSSLTHKKAGKSPACPLIADLDRITADVVQADVSDPVKFKVMLDGAVKRYVATIDRLKDVAPADLDDELDKVAAAVQQYRFQEAVTERTAIDDFAARECGRTGPSPTVPPTSTTTFPVATTTVGNTVAP